MELRAPFGHLAPRAAPKADSIINWLRMLGSHYMISPDTDLIYLPFPNRECVFDLYCSDMKEICNIDPTRRCSLTHFRKVWRENIYTKDIRIRKWMRFTKCDTCVDLRELHAKTKCNKRHVNIKTELHRHVLFVRRERDSYYQRRRESVDNPEQVLSIIIDGADQQVYGLPYYYQRTHGTDKCHKIPLHLMGVLVHGRGSFGISYPDSVKQGTNVTIDALHLALTETKRLDGKLPRKLYLQLDNTNKQCKNRFMLGEFSVSRLVYEVFSHVDFVTGWLACLVEWHVFDEVQLSFLPVGHTHEDIDQFFSRLAVYLRHHDSTCRHDMSVAIKSCYLQPGCRVPHVIHRDTAANISDWLEPQLGHPKRFPGVRDDFYCYSIIRRGGDNRAVVRCREWPGQPGEWRGFDFTKPHTLVLLPLGDGSLKPGDLTRGSEDCDRVPRAQRSERVGPGRSGEEQAKLDHHWKKLRENYSSMVIEGKLTGMAKTDLENLICLVNADPKAFDWDTTLYRDAVRFFESGEIEEHQGASKTAIVSKGAMKVADYALMWTAARDADPRKTSRKGRWRIAHIAETGKSRFKVHRMARTVKMHGGNEITDQVWKLVYDSSGSPLHDEVPRWRILMPVKMNQNNKISKNAGNCITFERMVAIVNLN